MKNFRGSALAAGVGTPESVPHELLKSSLHFYLGYKHRDWFCVAMAIVTAFNYDVGEKYYLRLCRLDGPKHDEKASQLMLQYCYEHSNFDITLGTLVYLAQRKGYKFSYKAVPKRDTGLD